MTPQAVIFDCDGVLVDSESIAFALLERDLSSYVPHVSRAQMERDLLGLTLAGVAEKARTLGADLPDTWVEDFYARLYARLEQGTPLVPGILGVLDALDVAGIPYAIGSNGSPRKMQITLGQHRGLIDRFQGRVFSGQETPRPKPFPDLFLKAAAAMNVAPKHCVVVEDSPTGARAARAAGMRCMGYAPHGAAALLAEGAEPFTRMTDLPALLNLSRPASC
ncbi:HAD-IA family hydrolase [bacterium]|nr:HAD-IA family hydrolase [bacterium]